MPVYITEHFGQNNYRQPIVQSPVASYSLSTTTGSVFPQAGTKFVRVTADSGSLLGIGPSASSTTSLTSTNAFRISANAVGEYFAVSTTYKLVASST